MCERNRIKDSIPYSNFIGRDGRGLRRRTKEWMWDGDKGRQEGRQADKYWRRFGQRTDTQEEDDKQSPGWKRWRVEPGRKLEEPGWIRHFGDRR